MPEIYIYIYKRSPVQFIVYTEMLRIIVDGEEHGRYDETKLNWIAVGSSETADVRLPWAAPTHLTIHFHNDRGHFVTIHDPEGMTHKGGHRVHDDGWRIFVSIGEPMTIRGHVITMMNA
jgi:hypothetical protein